MSLSRFKHFAVGAIAFLAPAVASMVASPAAQNFITAHPEDAALFPIVSGVIVQLYHELTKTKTAPAAVSPTVGAHVSISVAGTPATESAGSTSITTSK